MTDDEIDNLSVGSVFRYGKNRTLRVVRKVYRVSNIRCKKKPGSVYSVAVVKKRCSQYNGVGTSVDRWFLKRHCEVTGARVRLDHPMDGAFIRDLDRFGYDKELSCDIRRDFPG